jgi:hypothetical protein
MSHLGQRLRLADSRSWGAAWMGVFVLVGDTGIEPVTSTVSTPIGVVDRDCGVLPRSSDRGGRARRSVVLVAWATASADFLLTAPRRPVPLLCSHGLVALWRRLAARVAWTRCGTWCRAG